MEKTKLPKKYHDKIITMATDKKTSEMSKRAIAGKLNKEFERKKIYNKEGNKIFQFLSHK